MRYCGGMELTRGSCAEEREHVSSGSEVNWKRLFYVL